MSLSLHTKSQYSESSGRWGVSNKYPAVPNWAGQTIPSRSHPARYTVFSHSQITRPGANSCNRRLFAGRNAPAFGRRQYVSRRRRIEHAQSNIRALTDVFEEPQHAFAAVSLHHRRLDIG